MSPKSQKTGRLRGHRLVSRMQLLALALCLLASVAVVSCGSSVSYPQTTVPAGVDVPQNLVTPSEIAHAGPSTPQVALMRWFQAIQYHDYPTALELTTSRVRKLIGETPLRNAMSVVGSALGKPSITGVVAREADAVRIHLLVLGFSPASSKPLNETPVTVPLVKTATGWQVDNATYLLEGARALEALPHVRKPHVP
jgi:hypothetical protein